MPLRYKGPNDDLDKVEGTKRPGAEVLVPRCKKKPKAVQQIQRQRNRRKAENISLESCHGTGEQRRDPLCRKKQPVGDQDGTDP